MSISSLPGRVQSRVEPRWISLSKIDFPYRDTRDAEIASQERNWRDAYEKLKSFLQTEEFLSLKNALKAITLNNAAVAAYLYDRSSPMAQLFISQAEIISQAEKEPDSTVPVEIQSVIYHNRRSLD